MKVIGRIPAAPVALVPVPDGSPCAWNIQIKATPALAAGEGEEVPPEALKGWGECLPDLGSLEPDPE